MEAVKFTTKRDLWLGYLAFGVMAFVLCNCLAARQWAATALTGALTGLLIWIWIATDYTVTDRELRISCGPFRQTVPLGAIFQVRRTRNFFTAAALSTDRLALRYSKADYTLVSPRDKEGFIQVLRERCPAFQNIAGDTKPAEPRPQGRKGRKSR